MKTTITNKPIPNTGQVGISQMSITYIQGNDCVSGKDEYQTLEISTRNGGTKLEDTFFHLKTESWSIDDPAELADVINDFTSRLYGSN